MGCMWRLSSTDLGCLGGFGWVFCSVGWAFMVVPGVGLSCWLGVAFNLVLVVVSANFLFIS